MLFQMQSKMKSYIIVGVHCSFTMFFVHRNAPQPTHLCSLSIHQYWWPIRCPHWTGPGSSASQSRFVRVCLLAHRSVEHGNGSLTLNLERWSKNSKWTYVVLLSTLRLRRHRSPQPVHPLPSARSSTLQRPLLDPFIHLLDFREADYGPRDSVDDQDDCPPNVVNYGPYALSSDPYLILIAPDGQWSQSSAVLRCKSHID